MIKGQDILDDISDSIKDKSDDEIRAMLEEQGLDYDLMLKKIPGLKQ